VGADKVARFLMAIEGAAAGLRIEMADVNGGTGIVGFEGATPIFLLTADIADGQIQGIYLVNNPDKLNALAVGPLLRR
jgi:RNA polymerase sigma-70 factor (ECF subfamily)